MELFDLEIPIRSTGLDATREDFRQLERQGTESAAKVEQALARTAPPASVAQGFARTRASAVEAQAALEGVGRASTTTAGADASLAAQQQRVADGLRTIARDILQAKAAFDAGTLSTDDLAAALNVARQQAVDLKAGLALPTQQAEAFRAIMSATVPALAAADGAMQIIAEDVKLASAAFKAGTLDAEGYAIAMETARAQAIQVSQGTQLAGSELTAFTGILRSTAPATRPAIQGLGTMRSSLASLGVAALGARSSLGSLVSGLALFAGGSGPALGFIAGLTGIILLYEKWTSRTRAQTKATDELLASFRALNDEANRGADAARAAADKQTETLRQQVKLAEQQLATARSGATSTAFVNGIPVGDRSGVIAAAEKRLSEARIALAKAEADQMQDDARREVEANDRKVAALTRLVAAGRATAAQQQELRKAQADARKELAESTGAYAETANGLDRIADLTDRVTSIDEAFAGRLKLTTKEMDALTKAEQERTQALIALLQLETPTAERWQALTERAKALRAELDAGNLSLADRADRLRELQQIESATGFGDVGPFERIQTRGPDIKRTPGPLMTVPGVEGELDIPGGSGSLFGRMVAQLEAGGASAQEAIQKVHEKLAAAAASLSQGVADALTSAFSGNTDFGSGMLKALGAMVIQFGVAVIGIGNLMQAALEALSSLNPVAAIAAGAALVALGALISSAAKSSFTPASARGGTATAVSFTTTLGTPRTAPVAQTQANTAAVKAEPGPTFNVVHYGGRDPGFGRFLVTEYNAAIARGVA